MMTRWTVLAVAAALAGAVVAWLGLSAGALPAAEAHAITAPNPVPSTGPARRLLEDARVPLSADMNPVPAGQPANASNEKAAPAAGQVANTPMTTTTTTTTATATDKISAASPATAASPEQRAAAQALVLASFYLAPALATAQPAPVDLRRNRRVQALAATATPEPVSPADTGLRGFPGAEVLHGQSLRSGNAISVTSQAFASFKDVRSHFSAQLQPSADGVRQLIVLTDNDEVFDARVVDLVHKTIQRAQLAAGDTFVVVQLSRIDVR